MPKKRKKETKKVQKIIYIFCEGEKTEPFYLQGYIEDLADEALRKIVSIEKTRKNTPVQLVQVASQLKKDKKTIKGDEFWVVYDRESTAKYSEEFHAKAYNAAEGAGIKTALSSVCFEFWLLLHLSDTQAPYNSFDDLMSKSNFTKSFLAETKRDYAKSAQEVFSLLKSKVGDARARAKILNENMKASAAQGRDKPYQLNPYAGVLDLLDALDAFGKKS